MHLGSGMAQVPACNEYSFTYAFHSRCMRFIAAYDSAFSAQQQNRLDMSILNIFHVHFEEKNSREQHKKRERKETSRLRKCSALVWVYGALEMRAMQFSEKGIIFYLRCVSWENDLDPTTLNLTKVMMPAYILRYKTRF